MVTGLTVTTDSKHVYLNIGNSSGYDIIEVGLIIGMIMVVLGRMI